MEQATVYIWCPRKKNAIRKNPRACRANCKQKHRCEAYQKFWQPGLFDLSDKGLSGKVHQITAADATEN